MPSAPTTISRANTVPAGSLGVSIAPTLNFREATEHDSAAIAKLHAESWRSAYRGFISDDYLDDRVYSERASLWEQRFSEMATKPFFAILAEMLLNEVTRRLLADGTPGGLYLWVIEKNSRARQFYSGAGALEVDSAGFPMPDGSHVVQLRCYWPDPSRLLFDGPLRPTVNT